MAVEDMPSTPFGAPFDHNDADVILRSSDQVDFRVYRVILSLSSPFFGSMFSLPQPDPTSICDKQDPVVDLTENSKTIAALLTLIYPPQLDEIDTVVPVVTQPESLDDMMDTFAAAKKYDMATVSRRLIQQFAKSKVVQDNPVVAFCAAYSYKLGEVARVAAKASLKHQMNSDNIADKLRYSTHINGVAFHQLYKFHRACSAAAAEVVSDSDLTLISSPQETWWDFANLTCPPSFLCRPRHPYTMNHHQSDSSGRIWTAPPAYHDYITRAHKVLLEQPCREAVTNDVFLGPSYKEKGCQTCQLTMIGLSEFSRLLGDAVERHVSAVRYFLAYLLNTSHSIEGQSRAAILIFSGLSTYVHI